MGLFTVILPTCHGKTTLSTTSAHILDAGELCFDKEELRNKRRVARESNDWGTFDDYWVSEIRRVMLTVHRPDTAAILVPSYTIASKLALPCAGTILLDKDVFVRSVQGRPKSGLDNALSNYNTEENNPGKVVKCKSYREIEGIVHALIVVAQFNVIPESFIHFENDFISCVC